MAGFSGALAAELRPPARGAVVGGVAGRAPVGWPGRTPAGCPGLTAACPGLTADCPGLAAGCLVLPVCPGRAGVLAGGWATQQTAATAITNQVRTARTTTVGDRSADRTEVRGWPLSNVAVPTTAHRRRCADTRGVSADKVRASGRCSGWSVECISSSVQRRLSATTEEWMRMEKKSPRISRTCGSGHAKPADRDGQIRCSLLLEH